MDDIYAIIPINTFENTKSRLSPFLTPKERQNLLKAMLKDVTDALKKHVDKIIIISKDPKVLSYGEKLNLTIIKENYNSTLNKGIEQAIDYCNLKAKKVIITPSDIPLLGKTNVKMLIDSSKNINFTIVPSKGGGTNMIIMKPKTIRMKFGELSYLEHVKAAKKKKINPIIHDSFFIALDVNTTEDLGEIMIHGNGTHTQKYLKSLKIKVKSVHGSERLKVTRS